MRWRAPCRGGCARQGYRGLHGDTKTSSNSNISFICTDVKCAPSLDRRLLSGAVGTPKKPPLREVLQNTLCAPTWTFRGSHVGAERVHAGERMWVGRCEREGTSEKAHGLYGLKVWSGEGWVRSGEGRP